MVNEEKIKLDEIEDIEDIDLEITTEDDMDTDNVDIDIYCDFEEPTDPEVIKKLEKRFSYIFDKPQTLEDICLDGIVMAPDEISLIS